MDQEKRRTQARHARVRRNPALADVVAQHRDNYRSLELSNIHVIKLLRNEKRASSYFKESRTIHACSSDFLNLVVMNISYVDLALIYYGVEKLNQGIHLALRKEINLLAEMVPVSLETLFSLLESMYPLVEGYCIAFSGTLFNYPRQYGAVILFLKYKIRDSNTFSAYWYW
ncbi:hypothetical protein NECAME_02338 [Necator americanus]|uniref:Uncharacterized protein n=1 Tax=Necator americanus TaxID=51031 RepID=W2THC8_NECAM|nr:hypothetical protein NECAME_02338 [Necator americanus]ETN80591.1 hypothetical protein NECAME_02338 [Necator americanus]